MDAGADEFEDARPEGDVVIGVDVGSGSVRAAVVSTSGQILGVGKHPIQIHEHDGRCEQSSDEIWRACVQAVTAAVVLAEVTATQVKGLGFDATCSLVALDENFRPVAVSDEEPTDEWNVVMWMDHRAVAEAAEINATQHPALQFVGKSISPEMETPKLLWLKRHAPRLWAKAAHFFDLPDFLTFRATGSTVRSRCSLTCKWTYGATTAQDMEWDDSYFRLIGLEDLVTNKDHNKYSRIGLSVQDIGTVVGSGLSNAAAAELGLMPGTPVGVSMIDAFAGGIGVLGGPSTHPLTSRLAIIAGTSACHIVAAKQPVFVSGVWGPYWGVMIPGFYTTEGGQSAAGKLLDHIIESHAAYEHVKVEAQARNMLVPDYLYDLAARVAHTRGLLHTELLVRDVHILPDFHGNRSPLADPFMTGTITGLQLNTAPEESLAVLYVAAVVALALETRLIIETMNKSGHNVCEIYMCGGESRNSLYVQAHANATGMNVVLREETETVLLGAAMLGSCPHIYPNIPAAMDAMGSRGRVVPPQLDIQPFYDQKFKVLMQMYEDQRRYRQIMSEAP
eukprot:m.203924 g.203924  ORF g.203924 m.203924 type:complete len:563 (-) comp17740_c2_seq1:4332-6020(-)